MITENNDSKWSRYRKFVRKHNNAHSKWARVIENCLQITVVLYASRDLNEIDKVLYWCYYYWCYIIIVREIVKINGDICSICDLQSILCRRKFAILDKAPIGLARGRMTLFTTPYCGLDPELCRFNFAAMLCNNSFPSRRGAHTNDSRTGCIAIRSEICLRSFKKEKYKAGHTMRRYILRAHCVAPRCCCYSKWRGKRARPDLNVSFDFAPYFNDSSYVPHVAVYTRCR